MSLLCDSHFLLCFQSSAMNQFAKQHKQNHMNEAHQR